VAEAIAARSPARARAAMESHFASSIGEMLRDQV
jgi:DNA-binding FadR family transcriptional regulator